MGNILIIYRVSPPCLVVGLWISKRSTVSLMYTWYEPTLLQPGTMAIPPTSEFHIFRASDALMKVEDESFE